MERLYGQQWLHSGKHVRNGRAGLNRRKSNADYGWSKAYRDEKFAGQYDLKSIKGSSDPSGNTTPINRDPNFREMLRKRPNAEGNPSAGSEGKFAKSGKGQGDAGGDSSKGGGKHHPRADREYHTAIKKGGKPRSKTPKGRGKPRSQTPKGAKADERGPSLTVRRREGKGRDYDYPILPAAPAAGGDSSSSSWKPRLRGDLMDC